MSQCKDGSEYLPNETQMKYDFIPVDKSTYPEAQIRAKLARNRGWQVCRSWIDEKNKQFSYVCVVNANETAQRNISFEDACKDFHWKKFDVINNAQSLKWHKDPAWDEEMDKIIERGKKFAVKNAKKAKESEKKAED